VWQGRGVPAYLEVRLPSGVELVPLDADRVTIGRVDTNDVSLPADEEASRLHAVIERLAGGWCVRDLSSRNGTFVNGERVAGDRPLRAGDEVRVGRTRLVLRAEADQTRPTMGAVPAPVLTPRERDVLLALFRPALTADVFSEPASTKEMAAALNVSEAAVKQHLAHLYDKFEIYGEGDRRRVRLANEALRRGAVTLADVRAAHG
jgi:pSer/pThr/pTyr-binding forkhead associated (FHA) protein